MEKHIPGELKIIWNGNIPAVFRRSTLSLSIPDFRQKIHDIDSISANYPRARSSETIALVMESPQESLTKPHLHGGKTYRILARLAINVSNTCNMACKYCYANEGTYYGSESLMTESTALNTINFILRNFSRVELVNFFGGEPTLNTPIIEMICAYFSYLFEKSTISYMPKFGVTTNGYMLDDAFLHLMRKYNFRVAISVDGPKEIHDQLRCNKKGQSTFEAVEDTIFRLQRSGIQPEIECTYTRAHIEAGITVIQLMDFFFEKFRCGTLHCPLVITKPDDPLHIPLSVALPIYSDAIRESIRNLAKGIPKAISSAARLLNAMANKKPIAQYCGAGTSLLSVNSDGYIYPCFMLMEGKDKSMGSVNYARDKGGLSKATIEALEEVDKWKNHSCQECWIRPLCSGCLGEDFARHGQRIRRSAIPGQVELCDFKRSLVESFLKSILWTQLKQA